MAGSHEVLSITWHPASLGGRSGVARISHLDGHEDRRQMDRQDAEVLATLLVGVGRVERQLQGRGVEWTRSPN